MRLLTRFGTRKFGHWSLLLLMISSMSLLLVGLFSWQPFPVGEIEISVGSISPVDVVSPRQLIYESRVLTERARLRAAEAIPDYYDNSEGRVRRQQVNLARQVVETITSIRNSSASREEQLATLLTVPELGLSAENAAQILDLSQEDWEAVARETPDALDRSMREEIRDTNLSFVRSRVSNLISSQLSEVAGDAVAVLVRALIRPNSFLNLEKTAQLREEARANVEPQTRIYERGETIIRAGDRATADVVEAIDQLNISQQDWDRWSMLRAVSITIVILSLVTAGIARLRPETAYHYPELALLVLTSTIWLLAARFMITDDAMLPYFYPLAALGMLISILVDERLAIIVVVAVSLVAHIFAGNNPQIIVYLIPGSIIGILALARVERLNSFLWAGLLVAVINFFSIMAFRATVEGMVSNRLLNVIIFSAANGVISAGLAFLGYFLFGNLFGIATSLQLNELSRPTHPLLRQLQLKAPGTYFHTILVSNMAERAAATIGADALLTRVGAYYHDIGKTTRPYFFIENIIDGSSPHDKLEPQTSAQIIISHVTDGISLAQKYRLPQRVQDFIREHHGRSLVKYFYITALNAQNGEPVHEADFRYPGPSPRSKETAILLLADSCEAAIRARRPSSSEELNKMIDQLINDRIADGELNESNLTLRELKIIREVFQQVLQGVHHPRIAYPESDNKNRQPPAPATAPPPATAPAAAPNDTQPTSPPAGDVENETRPVTDAGSPVSVLSVTPLDEMA